MPDLSLATLANIFGTDKGDFGGDFGYGHKYAHIYERYFESRRNDPLNIIEIGVWKGASLKVWENYFPNAKIIGVENLESTVDVQLERAEVCIGDATDPMFLKQVLERFDRNIDIIIDDGSHLLDHQITSLEYLAPHLEANGLYFVEDVAGSRFAAGNRGFPPFRDFLDYACSVARQTTFFDNFSSDLFHTIEITDQLSEEPKRSFWNSNLLSVSFFYNLVVFSRNGSAVQDHGTIRPTPGEGYRVDQGEIGASFQKFDSDVFEEQFIKLKARANRLESENLWLSIEYKKIKSELELYNQSIATKT